MPEKKILITPLNWGLGHAARDIPLIRLLIKNNYEVIIAGEGNSLKLLKKEFPELTHVNLHSFSIKYPKNKLLIPKIIFQLPKILTGIKKEHKLTQKIIEKHKPDIIISDNRYGTYSKKIPSIFITHQISPALPKPLKIFQKLLRKIHIKKIQKFNICLIPDFNGKNNLSGKLSHGFKLPHNFFFIGILSRFKKPQETTNKKEYDIAVILSGPEPQRTILEKKITSQLKNTRYKTLIIKGKPGKEINFTNNNITVKNHLNSIEMQNTITNSEIIICRSGYSSIMDLITLNKKAILIPTPGQTEQEYLARYLAKTKNFVIRKQNKLNIPEALKALKNLNPDFKIYDNQKKENFIEIINKLIKKH